MKCMHCRGTMEKSVAPFHIHRKGFHLTLDEVPAWVCRQCGEPYFEGNAVDFIQEIIQTLEDRTSRLTVIA